MTLLSQKAKQTSIVLGGFSLLLGLLTWVKWSFLADAPVGVAIGLAGVGVSLAAAGWNLPRLAVVSAAFLAVFGGATSAYFVFGWTLPEQILASSTQHAAMIPVAALAFLLTGVALLVVSTRVPVVHRGLVLILAGCGMGSFAATVLILPLLESALAVEPFRSTFPNAPAAVIVLLLGSGLVFLGRNVVDPRERTMLKIPVAAGVIVLLLAVPFAYTVRDQQRRQVHRTVMAAARAIHRQLKFALTSQLVATHHDIEHIVSDDEPGGQRRGRLSAAMQKHAGLEAVAFLGASGELDWIVPQGTKVESVAASLESFTVTSDRAVIEPVDSVNGRGFAIYERAHNRDGVDPFLLTVFRYQPFLDTVLGESATGYDVTVHHGDELLYRLGLQDRPLARRRWMEQTELDWRGFSWTVSVWPTAETLRAFQPWTPQATFLAGNLLAFLLAISLQLAQTARRRAADLEAVNRELESEIDERRRTQEQLLQSQKMEAVGRLAGGVAHDFNNFLTVVHGYTELVDPLVSGEKGKKYVKEIRDVSERAQELTRQLLAFSRRQVLPTQVVDLYAVIEGLRIMLERLIGEDITLVSEGELEKALIKADPGQLQQVIVNLAVNARDAMPEGGTLTIRSAVIEIERKTASSLGLSEGSYAELTVRDTGIGMNESTLEAVFEPFFTTKEKGQGTGLGLSIVYGIVKQNGGSIRAASSPDGGSTFQIYFPLTREKIESQVSYQPEKQSLSRDGVTVLLAEDDDAVRQWAEVVLRQNGYRVLVARDGDEALGRVRDPSPTIDLLITDVIMPRMGGIALAERLLLQRPDLPVLFISGYPDRPLTSAAQSEDAKRAYLPKPFTADALLDEIRNLLEETAVDASNV